MDYTHRLEQANAIPDAPPTRGQYDESAIRAGALELTVARQRATIQAQRAEIERLNGAIGELEREGTEAPHQSFTSYDAFAATREYSESPHAERRDGQIENW